jgi:hypothetical protein
MLGSLSCFDCRQTWDPCKAYWVINRQYPPQEALNCVDSSRLPCYPTRSLLGRNVTSTAMANDFNGSHTASNDTPRNSFADGSFFQNQGCILHLLPSLWALPFLIYYIDPKWPVKKSLVQFQTPVNSFVPLPAMDRCLLYRGEESKPFWTLPVGLLNFWNRDGFNVLPSSSPVPGTPEPFGSSCWKWVDLDCKNWWICLSGSNL